MAPFGTSVIDVMCGPRTARSTGIDLATPWADWTPLPSTSSYRRAEIPLSDNKWLISRSISAPSSGPIGAARATQVLARAEERGGIGTFMNCRSRPCRQSVTRVLRLRSRLAPTAAALKKECTRLIPLRPVGPSQRQQPVTGRGVFLMVSAS